MGSSSSGNWGGRPTVEGCRTLDIGRLLAQDAIRPDGFSSGLYSWTNADSGEQTASIRYEAQLGATGGRLRLIYLSTIWPTGERRPLDYPISLVTTVQPFGGKRWWFLCPRTGRRVLKLYMPLGATVFASRHAYRLGYKSQRETSHDRAFNRAFKLRHKLEASGGIGDVIFKPKGMHQTTFERKLAKVWRAEAICDRHLMMFVDRYKLRRKS